MNDAELTKLAIAEIVREMDELKEPPVQERKINPLAKPNKRFLGRTLNSMLSHNKRENDRTQAKCQMKLRELDERREPRKSRSCSPSLNLALSSSSEEKSSRYAKKRRKDKNKYKKHKKSKKNRKKYKKRKSDIRDTSCSTGSSRSTSQSSRSSRYKKQEDVQQHVNEEQSHYEPDINVSMELNAALIANNYRQHQIQQLLYYSALMAENETTEMNALEDELQISDIDFTEPNVDKTLSSDASSLNLEVEDSETSEILQISLSSASSTRSKPANCKRFRKKRKKEVQNPQQNESSDTSNGVIWELDSDSVTADDISRENSICVISETDTDLEKQSDSDNTTNKVENVPTISNNIRHVVEETVTLLSSSDSDIEVFEVKETDIDAAAISASAGDNVNDNSSLLEKNLTSNSNMSTTLILTSQHMQKVDTTLGGKFTTEIVAEELLNIESRPNLFRATTECFTSSEEIQSSSALSFTEEAQQISAPVMNKALSRQVTKDSLAVIELAGITLIQSSTAMPTIGSTMSQENVKSLSTNEEKLSPNSQTTSALTCLENFPTSIVIGKELVLIEEGENILNKKTATTSFVNTYNCRSPPNLSTTESESLLMVPEDLFASLTPSPSLNPLTKSSEPSLPILTQTKSAVTELASDHQINMSKSFPSEFIDVQSSSLKNLTEFVPLR